MSTSRRAAACCLVAAMATTGCSAMLSKPPRQAPIVSFYDCSDSKLPVLLDGFWIIDAGAVALAGFGGAAIRNSQAKDDIAPSWNPRPDTSGLMTLLAIGTVATGVTVGLIYSALYGARSADACIAARADLLSRPPVYLAPPPGPP